MKSLFALRGHTVFGAPLSVQPYPKTKTIELKGLWHSAVAFLFFELNQLAETSFPVFDNTIPNEAYVIQSTPLVRRRIRPLVNSAILHDNKSNKESVLYYVGGWSELRRIRPSLNLTKKRQGKLIFCLGNLGRKRANPIRFPMNPRVPSEAHGEPRTSTIA